MYVLNIIKREIIKMDNYDLASFLNECSQSKIEIANFVFIPNKKEAKTFIKEILNEELPKCHHWK